MGFELPLVAAVLARLADPSIHLAAYGGVVFPVSLMIEGPIIMLLAASTALSRDLQAYRLIRRFMNGAGLALTLVHATVAFTPLYDVVVAGWMGAPKEILAPARLGLMIMTPWTWSIAFRRFQQGVLIRFGHSRAVAVGTVVRLATMVTVLSVGYLIGTLPGIVVGTSAVACAVLMEATVIGLWVRRVVSAHLKDRLPPAEPLELKRFLFFYAPLALTPLITLTAQPISSASVSRMPLAVESLAVIPVLNGLSFLLRSVGFSYNEVVVALLDRPEALIRLRRFAGLIALGTTSLLLLFALTPLGSFYFATLVGLDASLDGLALRGLWLILLMPALAVGLHFFQGILVYTHRTVAVTEAVALNFAVMVLLLLAGVRYGAVTGLFVALGAHLTGNIVQTGWLWYRGQGARRALGNPAPAVEPPPPDLLP